MQLRKDIMANKNVRKLMRRMKFKSIKGWLSLNIIMWIIVFVFFKLFEASDSTVCFYISSVVGSVAGVHFLLLLRLLFSEYKIYQVDILDKGIEYDESTIYYVNLCGGTTLSCCSKDVYNQIVPYTTELVWYYAGEIRGIFRGVNI